MYLQSSDTCFEIQHISHTRFSIMKTDLNFSQYDLHSFQMFLPACPSESGRTQIGDGRPNPAELRLGTAVRIRPNSDLGRPSESGRTQIWDGRPNPAELRLGTTAGIRPKDM